MIYVFLIIMLAVVLLLVLWQFSNIVSMGLGAPAITSPKHQLWQKFADPDKTILDLGCGSGTVCLQLAPHFRQVYGIEYSPFYYLLAKWRTRHLKNVTIVRANFREISWPATDYIYCYLLTDLLGKILPKLGASSAIILSLAFQIPGRKPKEVIEHNKQRLFVYCPQA